MTPEGLEPPTDRTGICYSIQLNYGAVFYGAKIRFFVQLESNIMRRHSLFKTTSTKRINGQTIWINICAGRHHHFNIRSIKIGPFYGS